MDKDNVRWVKVYENEDRFAVDLASITMKEAGVDNVIMDKKDTTHVMIGFLEIYVPQELVIKAKKILADFEG